MDWISQFLSKLFSFIPRLWIVDPDESGVRTTPKLKGGIKVKELTPGWWIVWPLLQNAEKIKIKTQVVNLRPQSVWTNDGQEIVISGSIKYRVASAKDSILNVCDHDANIQSLALGIIFDYVTDKNLENLKRDFKLLKDEILKGLREASRGWGLKIEVVYLTDIGKTQNLRLLLNEPILKIEDNDA